MSQQDKQVGSIIKTTSYDRYKFNSLQRVTKEKHVKDLMEKMKSHGFLPNKAISVNEKNEIIDGHHRYLAAKSLGIPMLIQVCKGMTQDSIIQANQLQENWNKHDFTNTYAIQGNPNYIALKEFMEKYPKFKMTQALILLVNEPNAHPRAKVFQSGEFKIGSIKKAEEVAKKVEELALHHPKAYGSKCISALMCCEMRCKGFSFKEFIEKLSKFPDKLTPSITTKAYLEKFEEVYNYHRAKKQQLRLRDLSSDFEK
jgi:hypothetical protein